MIESHRTSGADPDEYAETASLPLDSARQLGPVVGAAPVRARQLDLAPVLALARTVWRGS
ncbi:hypothetical protein ACIA5G_34220 [Amycolatopsis sp. NPDC051758]|uniref:hypothetical protein n=1 Tax=Amycolatopsis sp. NPDC051758 TaxID=3363935 RepID=UPI0037BCC99B